MTKQRTYRALSMQEQMDLQDEVRQLRARVAAAEEQRRTLPLLGGLAELRHALAAYDAARAAPRTIGYSAKVSERTAALIRVVRAACL